MDRGHVFAESSVPVVRAGARDARAALWPAIAAWGSGLIHLALGAGAVTAPAGMSPVALPLIALAATDLAWGATVLARGRVLAPRAGVAGVLAGLLAGALALWADPARTSVAAVAAASVLLLAVGIGCARALRPPRAGDAASPRIVGLVVAAVVVSAIVTPALTATEAGRHAHEHGAVPVDEPHHGP